MQGYKTIVIAILGFVTGLITYVTGTDLWGLIPAESNATEIVLMIQSALMFILRIITETPVFFKTKG